MMKKVRPPLLYDPQIIPRVKQYLEENVHQTYVDVAVMAKELQDRYREYSRRKVAPFRSLVEQAYKTVLHSYGLDSNPSSENDGEGNSDLELMDEENTSSNHMNDTMTAMYMGGNKNKSAPANNDGELIDISSDESGDEDDGILPTPVAGSDKSNNFNAIRGITITKVNQKNHQHQQPHQQSHQQQQHQHQHHHQAPSTKESHGHSKKTSSNNARLGGGESGGFKVMLPSTTQQQISKKRKLEAAMEAGYPPSGARLKKFKNPITANKSPLTFENVGGMEKVLKELCELLLHVKHPEVYKYIGLPPPRGFLLHGPPGCGKTLLAQAIAGQLNVPLIEITATELIAGVSGESEERIRDLFEQAAAIAPCVLFIDEVDAISSNRVNASKDMERRIVTQLLSCLDGLSKQEKGDQVLVIGATSRADCIDPALRRVGRFDQEISLGIPDKESRENILRVICEGLELEHPFDFKHLSTLTPGYVGADLLALATRAASTAVKRVFAQKGEDLLKKKFSRVVKQRTSLTNIKNTIPPVVVNLTDDSLLMDIDDVPIENNAEKKTDEVKTTSPNGEVIIIATIDEPKETEKEVNEKMTIEEQEPVENKTNGESKETEEKKDETTTTESPKIATVETPKESEDLEMLVVPSVIEVKDGGDVNIKTDSPTAVKEVVDVEKNSDEKIVTDKVADDDDDDVEEILDESLEDAVLKQPGVKLQLTLCEMMSWLSEKHPPVFGRELNDLCITTADFIEAIKHVQPSAKREGFITVPDTTWDDIGSLGDIREELKLAILAPVKFPEKLKILGLNAPSGVLLCGPPGCGKTLLAKAVANEAGINFISVKGPELLNMYVGESERAVRQCFQRARNSAPCVIFFDEFDSLCPKRSDVGENGAGMRVVNQLLTEMDGIEGRNGVFLMAATNRPDIVDPAVLRPGRLDKILYVGLPKEADRADILKALTKNGTKPKLASDVQLIKLANLTNNYTGADLAGLVRQASLHALKDSISTDSNDNDNDLKVTNDHFMRALQQLKPSVSAEDQRHYEKLRLKYAAPNQLSITTF